LSRSFGQNREKNSKEYPPEKRLHILTSGKGKNHRLKKVAFLGKAKLVGGFKYFFFTPIWGRFPF